MDLSQACNLSESTQTGNRALRFALWCLAIPLSVLWSYWPIVERLVQDWRTDDDYSVGALVPLAAVYLVWRNWNSLRGIPMAPCWWWGLGLLLFAQVVRAFGLVFLFKSAERYSLVLTIAAGVLLLGGRGLFSEVRWILLLLLLMVPLPGRIHGLIAGTLQAFAAAAATFTLELFGAPVVREGNVLVLDDTVSVAIAEACSGLRMLTAFVVVAAVLAFVVRQPRWLKVVLLISSAPVAIICNTARLVATSCLYLAADNELAECFFHDCAGLFMMPLAIVLLIGELWLMSRLVAALPQVQHGIRRQLTRIRA